MARITPQEQRCAILDAVGRFPNGASLELIANALLFTLARRTLQRRLASLVKAGDLAHQGRGAGSIYYIPRINDTANGLYSEENSPVADDANGQRAYLSPEAEKVQRAIQQPVRHRKPVGYNREFLDAYTPNQSFYLPDSTRLHLMRQGRGVPRNEPAGTYVRKIYDRLLIDLSWNSSRLEGNTYSLLETERLLQQGESPYGKDAREAQMILNHRAAIELLADSSDEVGFNRYTILNLHALLAENLLNNSMSCGRLRDIPVAVHGTVFYPLEAPQMIEECFATMLVKAANIENPFEQAFFIMVHLPYLQPFEDVNKRTSRLAANIPLIRENLCPLSFVDVPQQRYVDAILAVYELNRIEPLRDLFVWAYARSCARYSSVRKSLGEPDLFRMRYRVLIAEIVAEIVRGGTGKTQAISQIRQCASSKLPEEDQARFIEVAETELISLHEGNIARYRLRPSEYLAWKSNWQ
jgi:fido (protein-threonine AMPylation protein)